MSRVLHDLGKGNQKYGEVGDSIWLTDISAWEETCWGEEEENEEVIDRYEKEAACCLYWPLSTPSSFLVGHAGISFTLRKMVPNYTRFFGDHPDKNQDNVCFSTRFFSGESVSNFDQQANNRFVQFPLLLSLYRKSSHGTVKATTTILIIACMVVCEEGKKDESLQDTSRIKTPHSRTGDSLFLSVVLTGH